MQWLGRRISDQGDPGSSPGRGAVRCDLELVTPCLVLVKPRKRRTDELGQTQEASDGRIWTNCDEAGDYVVPNVLSPRDLVSRPDNMDETVPHTRHGNQGAHFLLCHTCIFRLALFPLTFDLYLPFWYSLQPLIFSLSLIVRK